MTPGAPARNASTVEPRVREILGGAAVFRVLALVWALAVIVIDGRSGVLDHPLAAFAALAIVAGWTGAVGVWAQFRPTMLVRPAVVAADLTLAVMVVALDSLLYDGPHPQSFGSAWPLAAVVSAGAVLGWKGGVGAGAAIGLANLVAAGVTGSGEGRLLALSGTLVLMAAGGAVAGIVVTRLRSAESEVAGARAREEFARTLHDGVLQTLAAIQRRSDDAALVELAREQEHELRAFVEERTPVERNLMAALRRAAARAERHHGARVRVVVVEPPSGPPERVAALAGAATEAITNAAKHAGASVITVCVDRLDGGSVVTVHDDGRGFDPGAADGTGLTHSVRGRIEEAGGRVTIESTPDRGTEVMLWVP